jgi:hypothetical protein
MKGEKVNEKKGEKSGKKMAKTLDSGYRFFVSLQCEI